MKEYDYPLQQSSLLAQVGNSGSVVVREHFITKDGISNLRRVNQVHLQESGLEVTLLRFILLERIQEEGRRGLNHVLGHENIHNLQLLISRLN